MPQIRGILRPFKRLNAAQRRRKATQSREPTATPDAGGRHGGLGKEGEVTTEMLEPRWNLVGTSWEPQRRRLEVTGSVDGHTCHFLPLLTNATPLGGRTTTKATEAEIEKEGSEQVPLDLRGPARSFLGARVGG